MPDFVIKSNDMLKVTIAPPAIVPLLASPVPLVGTGVNGLLSSQPLCLEGDEIPPPLRAPLTYTAPPFVTPGTGLLTVTLTPANKTLRGRFGGRAVLLKGAAFTATFNVIVPATQPSTPPVPDPVLVKSGTAQFITSTVNARAG